MEKKKLNKKDHRAMDIMACICRIILTPIALICAIYIWTWNTISENYRP